MEEFSVVIMKWFGPNWLKRRKDATSHIILDNLYLREKDLRLLCQVQNP
jgi:hypothetical protein